MVQAVATIQQTEAEKKRAADEEAERLAQDEADAAKKAAKREEAEAKKAAREVVAVPAASSFWGDELGHRGRP